MKESIKEKMELLVEAGMQCIPVVGSPLASLYFGEKQNKRFKRIENFYKEVSEELEAVKEKIVPVSSHNEEELSAILEELNDKVESEHIKLKVELYKNYFKNTMIYPVNNNYSERKLLLDIIKELSPLEIELLVFLKQQKEAIINTTITKPGVEDSIVQGCIAKIKMLGLVSANLNSIVLGGNCGSASEQIKLSSFGEKFHKFCIEFRVY
ncbi:hypothetical protein P6P39_10175 [Clostridium perfringens]|uniref:hypothetical protein n=1 Tax=Clostridium perfringens TaxID=1502 RepID=UPI0024BCE841|nr:hypothetical protein [Clostridium perfringens]MDK0538488.1 hypothetical protein [Clostridium perfringens]